jgi:PST family polysaccharide transporter
VDALGLYSRAFRFAALPANLLGDSVGTVLFAAMAKVQNEQQRLQNAFRQGTALTALLVMPLSALAIVLAPEFFVVVLGPQWSGAILPFQILAVGMFCRAGWKIGVAVLRAKGAISTMAIFSAIYAALIVAGALAGQFFGLVGVAVGVATATVLYYFLNLYQIKPHLTLSWIELLGLHVPAVITTTIVLISASVVAGLVRQWGWSELAVIVVTAFGVGAALLACVWWVPRLVFGTENLDWLRLIAGQFLGKIKPSSRAG